MAQPLADYPIQPRLSVQPARHAAAMAPTPMEEFRKQQRARRRGESTEGGTCAADVRLGLVAHDSGDIVDDRLASAYVCTDAR